MKIVFSLSFLLCLFSATALIRQTHTISGFMRDARSGESLIGAHVINQKTKKGTPTNTYGFFSLSQLRDTVELVFSYVGYKTQRTKFFLKADTSLQVQLIPLEELDELVITAEADDSVEEVQMSRIEVPIA